MMPAIPRRRRTLPALAVAAICTAAGVTVVIDVIAVATVHHSLVWPYEQMARLLRENTWNTTAVLAIAAGIAFIGILLLAAAALPGRQKLQPLNTGDPDVVAGATRRSLHRTLTDTARDVDGIANAHVAVGRRRIKVTADSYLRDPAGQREAVTTAVAARLDQLDPHQHRSVQTRVRRQASR
jgi:hypothetical protein